MPFWVVFSFFKFYFISKNEQKNIELESGFMPDYNNTNTANDVFIPRVNSDRKIDPNLRTSSRAFAYRSSSRLTFDNNMSNRSNRNTNRIISAYNFGSVRKRPSSAPIRRLAEFEFVQTQFLILNFIWNQWFDVG